MLLFAKNIFEFLLIIIEAEDKLMVNIHLSDVWSFNVRIQIGYAEVLWISASAGCVWVV